MSRKSRFLTAACIRVCDKLLSQHSSKTAINANHLTPYFVSVKSTCLPFGKARQNSKKGPAQCRGYATPHSIHMRRASGAIRKTASIQNRLYNSPKFASASAKRLVPFAILHLDQHACQSTANCSSSMHLQAIISILQYATSVVFSAVDCGLHPRKKARPTQHEQIHSQR